jgi:hypothetical protein
VKNLYERVDGLFRHKYFWHGCLVWYFCFAAAGFFASIVDHHQFRQAQTAWGARSIAEGVNPLRYEVPVLGPPWSAPFEFPVYQALTGWGSKFTGLDLIFVGRIVGIAFFLLSVFCGCEIFRMLGYGLRDRRIIAAFFLLSPFYIFWSRAIMMESTALGLAIMSVYFFLKMREKLTFANFLGFTLACVFAAIVKVTTFFAFALFISLWVAWMVVSQFRIRGFHFAAFVGLLVSVVAEVIWARYSDSLRMQGILTELFKHDGVMLFVTGELPLKFELDTWARFVERGRLTVGHKLFFAPLIALPWMSSRLRWLSVVALFFIFVPFLAFTNVHVKHDYYAFAHGFGFIMLYCALLIHMLETPRWRAWGAGIVIGSFAFLFTSYITKDAVRYRKTAEHQTEIDFIKANSQKDDVILISGLSWDPTIPFLAERRAAMFQFPLAGMSDQVKAMLKLLKEQNYRTPMWVFCDVEIVDADLPLVTELLGATPKTIFETKACKFLGL